MKNQMIFELRLSEEMLRQITLIAESENRSVNNHILMLIKNSIQYHERAKGRLDPQALKAVQIEGRRAERNES